MAKTDQVPVPAAAPPKKGKALRLLGLLLGGAVFLAAGFGAGFVYFANPLSPSDSVMKLIEEEAPAPEHGDAEGTPQKVPRVAPETGGYVTSYYTFAEPLTSNLRDSRKFLQVTVAVSTEYDATILDKVKAHEPALRADVLKVISNFSEEDMAAPDGRDRLAAEMLTAINARLEKLEGFGGIKEVIFPAFITQ